MKKFRSAFFVLGLTCILVSQESYAGKGPYFRLFQGSLPKAAPPSEEKVAVADLVPAPVRTLPEGGSEDEKEPSSEEPSFEEPSEHQASEESGSEESGSEDHSIDCKPSQGVNVLSLYLGQKVIPDSFTAGYGILRGVNSECGYCIVEGSNDRKNHKVTHNEIALTVGTLNGVSVGSQVYPNSYTAGYGIVEGINFNTGRYVIKGSNDRKLSRFSLNKMALSWGALDGVSVGSRVYPHDFVRGYGIVLGINYQEKTYLIKGSNDQKYYWYRLNGLGVSNNRY
jgi:hypothetical protein